MLVNNRLNISLILMILALLALNPSAVLAGSFINAVTRIDISDGVVTGVGAEYTFALPNSWLGGSVSVNRERPARGSQFIDKLIFLYRPIDRISMPTVFATLHVYENRPNFNLHPPGSRKILETDKYVFIFESVSRNNFTDPVDRAAFDQHISSAANDAMMAGQIDVPGSERIIPTNTVNVNGRVLRNHAVRGAAGTIYIPVREASNMLGYTVAWSAATNVVTLNSPERNHTVTINLNPGADRYSTIIINDRSFISTAFFMRELNANIEVDGNNNVIITTTVR